MKKKSQPILNQDLSETLHSFAESESRVFREDKGTFYIGNDEIDPTLLSYLKDEAEIIQKTRLWEILSKSILNEAYHLSLIQSTSWDHVQFAKSLNHWNIFMQKVIHKLSKK